ncbi:hypothetical protein DICSQDRAFT_175388 [Dichomitus squalens LYAD-421 SS1]|uniref:Uncharacterized protein n=1 Tax=Dichomitus squalens (strain LYAD-421) TaxID=732165 RepID=R7SLJ1_DICSQ|nr:uncharacterized protein DICSQDRAFT_175388 [Dichomitus squalens LYAD-421 SS1]EJF55912.1 hypothetical protein DICSQDRAFT_175388 [Dichomitus squalens LYAD-421 SS1]
MGDSDVVVLIGEEGAVNTFTRGHFQLEYRNKRIEQSKAKSNAGTSRSTPNDVPGPAAAAGPPTQTSSPSQPLHQVGNGLESRSDHPSQATLRTDTQNESQTLTKAQQSRTQPHLWIPPQESIRACSLLLMVQCLSQLLFIPQGTLFGQLIMLSSIHREEIQTDILFDILGIGAGDVRKYAFNNWMESVVFTSLVLASANYVKAPRALLNGMLPNDTLVWNMWKNAIERKLTENTELGVNANTNFEATEEDRKGLPDMNDSDIELRKTFVKDAEVAWKTWTMVGDDNCFGQ